MSEIKGQLLGIVLVVSVFGVVGGVLVTAFHKSSKAIATKIETDTDPVSSETSANENLVTNDSLLTF